MAKRIFDLLCSLTGLVLLSWLLVLLYLIASAATRSQGLFLQKRIGRYGVPFTIYKFRTLHPVSGRIDPVSRFLRKSKMDELPQLWNVVKGDMSLVGPRPDVQGYYDSLTGCDRAVLDLRPGITGPASLKYFDEEKLLAQHENAQKYNDEVIFPDKVMINLAYRKQQSVLLDIKILFQSVFGVFFRR
ncbi:sugar transferase [uncultured Flavobacterium sp.]|uniref:sugar transferase n=1 Tax=uncultured Flavobacterium sp. TaxID=165435 RepID=UPI0025DDFB5F|nr:sugar transferase [uncultured Flavobacterium sp.]